jgi:hypothetical protein
LEVARSRLRETFYLAQGPHRLTAASRALFLGAEPGKFDMPFFPGFFSRLGLCAADELQQTTSSPAEIDIIA